MSFDELLEALVTNDIKIRVEGDNLRIKADRSALTSDLTQQIKTHKASLLSWARKQQVDNPSLPKTPFQAFVENLNVTLKYHDVASQFSDMAVRNPDSIAVEYRDQKFSYAQINDGANRVANTLIDRGLEQEAIIGLLIDNPVDHLIAVIGSFKAGAMFASFGLQNPIPHIRQQIESARPSVWVCSSNSLSIISEIYEQRGRTEKFVILIDGIATGEPVDIDALADSKLRANCTSFTSSSINTPPTLTRDRNAPCYIYFTSGSTGTPKPIVGRTQGLAHFIEWEIDTFKIDKHARVSQLTAPTFDAYLRDVFVPLCSGATLCIPPQASRNLTPDVLVSWIQQQAITLVHCVPSLFRTLLSQHLTPEHFSALQHVLLAGEPLLPRDVKKWQNIFGQRVELVNLYGASETTMVKCFHRVTPEDAKQTFIPVGRAMSGAAVIVLDEQGRVCPRGEIGEIYIRSPYVSLGYYQQAEMTQRAFVANPLMEGDTVYRTGDLGTLLPDGNLRFLGRRDQQVKVNGIRIELSEIENALLAQPDIQEAAVIATTTDFGDTVLHAYYENKEAIPTEELRAFLSDRLPASFLPSTYTHLDNLPLTPTGKIDRKALQQTVDTSDTQNYVAPVTPTQQQLADIWQEVLGLERVGIQDNFFEIGGHSLRALLVISKIRKTFEVEFPLGTLFDAPTITQLAELIDNSQHSHFSAIEPLPQQAHYSPSRAQMRLWLLRQFDADSSAYHIPAILDLPDGINNSVFEQVLNTIIERHETLRTVFNEVDEQVVQFILPPSPITLQQQTFESTDALQQAIKAFTVAPFDFINGPLFRAQIIVTPQGQKQLLWCMHEIIADGTSSTLFQKEAEQLLQAFRQGLPNPLAPLRIQYKDYAAWQNRMLEEDSGADSRNYWHTQLSGKLPVLDLPFDFPLTAQTDTHGAYYEFTVPAQVQKTLHSYCQSHQVTPFMLLQATLTVALCNLTGQKDIILGSPVAGRDHIDLQPLIGFFLNTILLRYQTMPTTTFAQLLQTVKKTTLDGLAHQHYPFEQLVDELDVSRQRIRFPLTSILLNVMNFTDNTQTLDLFEARHCSVDKDMKIEFEIDVFEYSNGMRFRCIYRTGLFRPETIEYLMRNFVDLLQYSLNDSSYLVDEAPIYKSSQGEVDGNISINSPALSFMRTLDVPLTFDHPFAAFESQVKTTPDAIAVSYANESLSYQVLYDRSLQIAIGLQNQGLIPGQVVGVLTDNPLEQLAALLGIMQTRGVIAIMNTGDPITRLKQYVKVTQVYHWVGNSTSIERLPTIVGDETRTASVLLLNRDAPISHKLPPAWNIQHLTAFDSGKFDSKIDGDDPCYIYFTSGSTGTPKPIVGRAQSLAHFIQWEIDTFKIDKHARVSQLTAPTFDAYLRDVFVPLCSGATLYIPPQASRNLTPDVLVSWIQQQAITLVHCVPSLFRTLLTQHLTPEHFSALQHVLLAGEPLLPHDVKQWQDIFGQRVELVNLYGASETTMVKCFHRVTPDDAKQTFIPVGRAMSGAAVIVLDEQGRVCPRGEIGEIYIRSPYVSLGYYQQAEMTQRAFVANPLMEGDTVYRTGDLGTLLPDGNLRFLGRRDQQVKVNGIRIELSEIENALLAQPDIQEAAVIATTTDFGDTVLHAYYENKEAIPTEELRAFLSDRLPASFLPSTYTHLDNLPLTPTGKIDRKALQQTVDTSDTQNYVAPVTPTQQQLADIWQEVLGLERVGIQDNFFEIGGHSLRALLVISKIRKTFEVEFPLGTLFDAPTITQLAELIDNSQHSHFSAIEPLPQQAHYSPSRAQMRLWLLRQFDADSSAYHIPAILDLPDGINNSVFEQVLNTIIERHETLRTVFNEVDEQVVQFILPPSPITLQQQTFESTDALQQAIKAFTVAPFDFINGPLFRAQIIVTPQGQKQLLWCMHEIIADGTSSTLFQKEAEQLLQAFRQGLPNPLAPLRIQYKDYAAWQNRMLEEDSGADSRNYWHTQLSGKLPVLDLPFDFPLTQDKGWQGERYTFSASPTLSAQLEEFCSRHQVTLFMTLHAALSVLLARLTGQKDIIIASPVAGRDHIDLQPLIGFFLNTILLRHNINSSNTVTDFLKQVKNTTLSGLHHQHYPFDELIKELNISRDLNRFPGASVLLNVLNFLDDEIPVENKEPHTDTLNWDMKIEWEMFVLPRSNGLLFYCQYRSELFKPELMEYLMNEFVHLLGEFVTHPTSKLSQLDVLLPERRVDHNGNKININSAYLEFTE
ncbi:MAG: amino acid adenylation domain-containing protein [Gammaproteobacteria bacterium]|nr:amino acid adenylation domain-containing protein [Gammaproteobacteria bacterium]